MSETPLGVLAWMRLSGFGGPEAAFNNHNILIAGRKEMGGDFEKQTGKLQENK